MVRWLVILLQQVSSIFAGMLFSRHELVSAWSVVAIVFLWIVGRELLWLQDRKSLLQTIADFREHLSMMAYDNRE